MNFLERLAGRRPARPSSLADVFGFRDAEDTFVFGGREYLGLKQTLAGSNVTPTGYGLSSYMRSLKACPPAFGAQLVRSNVLSQARFVYRRRRSSASAGETFRDGSLDLIETPWPNGTTAELMTILEWHAGVAGNAFVAHRGDSLRVLNPQWCGVLLGSEDAPKDAINAVDAEIVGYVYQPGGIGSGSDPRVFLPEDIAHWSPLPDPENPFIGMSWLTPAIREIDADRGYTEHKIKFIEQGATPNLVVKGIPAVNDTQFQRYVEMMEASHGGVANAYKTLYLVAGSDATVVGSDLAQMDFKNTQGAGETRISVLSRVPAPILGISEGLAGSSLNAGNFGQARRNMADGWLYPTLQSVAGALGSILPVPADSELWFDTTDMPFVREDAKDLADIQYRQAQTIRNLTDAGFTPASATAAVISNDMSKLEHSGLYSVQLQKPGEGPAKTEPSTGVPADD